MSTVDKVEGGVSRPDIRLIVHEVVNRFQPQRVVLFGSHAYGKPHEGSDVDLLVVMDDPPQKRWEAAAAVRSGSRWPVQIVFMGTEEFEETRGVVGGLAYPATHDGKLLYQKNP